MKNVSKSTMRTVSKIHLRSCLLAALAGGGCGAEILEAGWEVREVRGSGQILESFIGRVKI